MDTRDRQLNRHMRRRFAIAAQLDSDRQKQWAARCVDQAFSQGRTAYYLMAKMWLDNVERGLFIH